MFYQTMGKILKAYMTMENMNSVDGVSKRTVEKSPPLWKSWSVVFEKKNKAYRLINSVSILEKNIIFAPNECAIIWKTVSLKCSFSSEKQNLLTDKLSLGSRKTWLFAPNVQLLKKNRSVYISFEKQVSSSEKQLNFFTSINSDYELFISSENKFFFRWTQFIERKTRFIDKLSFPG